MPACIRLGIEAAADTQSALALQHARQRCVKSADGTQPRIMLRTYLARSTAAALLLSRQQRPADPRSWAQTQRYARRRALEGLETETGAAMRLRGTRLNASCDYPTDTHLTFAVSRQWWTSAHRIESVVAATAAKGVPSGIFTPSSAEKQKRTLHVLDLKVVRPLA
ncbi:Uu.00g142850.m01.CDS01 [Anthostomella pinea]|uniref:Uu.00g142850.m01.CDS01 n=1 Tax=Anthostomella pinea TaxID=933095 RepID=A0AAI8YLM7_9PEZI|nr:Uu.00g142850.m01.CDS01 [Anthostomella pinea]